MKKSLFLAIALLTSGSVFAAADHYVLREGDVVRHLKVVKIKDDYTVRAEVDYDSTANGANEHCAADIAGKAKVAGKDELTLKKHSESEASFCELKILLSPTGAKIEEGKECGSFEMNKCRFSSEGKELVKVQ